MNTGLTIPLLPSATQIVDYSNDLETLISQMYETLPSLLLAVLLVSFGLCFSPRTMRWFRIVFTWISALLVHLYLANLSTFWRTSFGFSGSFTFGSSGPFGNHSVVLAQVGAQIACWGMAVYVTASARRSVSELHGLLAGPIPLGLAVVIAFFTKIIAYNVFTSTWTSMKWESVFPTIAGLFWMILILVAAFGVCAALIDKRKRRREP